MRSFLKGERTWAQVEGMTFAQAQKIAQIGCELAERGRLSDACVLFEGLVAGNPRDSSAQGALGTVYVRLGRLADAMECFDAAVQLWPDNLVALTHRGELRLRKGDRRGVEDLARAAQLDERGISAAGRRARRLLQALAARAARKPSD